MKKRNVIRAVLLLAVLGGGAAYFARMRKGEAVATTLFVSGTIEVTEVQASFKQPGRLAVRTVDEGVVVTAGQVIAMLDMSDLLIECATRSSEVWAARAALDELEHGSRPQEIEQAKASLALAQAELVQAHADFVRQESLVSQDVVSRSVYDQAKRANDVAEAQVRVAEETLKLLVEGPRIEEIERGRATLATAESALAAVRQRLHDAVLCTSFDGVTLSKSAEPGEYLSAGTPVLALADIGEVWLRAYVDEPDLGRVKLGQSAAVTTDTYPGKVYAGRITFISSEAEFTPKFVQTEKERVKLVYRIKITMPNPHWELKPGMPADARIRLD
ncbi:HlyD family efflux transporter periplasmic adaptor subunit [bacterium]|nr:HlyD family efflux transporter periplasmic adaptor subunit [bacterium]